MWQRFTERARKVIFYSQEEAKANNETYVSTEHILLGLTRESDHVAAKILDRLGVPLDRIRPEVNKHISPGTDKPGGDMQLTPRAKRVIDQAYDEARLLRNNYIGTEHLLLGLVREGEGLAGRVLADLGVKLEECRREIVALQNEKKQTGPETEELLTMDDAAQFLGVSKPTLYRLLSANELKGVKVGRQWRFRKEDLAAYLGGKPAPAEVPSVEIDAELDWIDSALDQAGSTHPHLSGTTIGNLAAGILRLAIATKASDIHLEPVRSADEAYLLMRLRNDGALGELRRFPRSVGDLLLGEFKALSDIDADLGPQPQEGRIPVIFPVPTGSAGASPASSSGGAESVIVDLVDNPERDAAKARATQTGLPFVDLTKNYPLDPEAARLVPEEIARRYNMVALRRDAKNQRLWVAVCDEDPDRVKEGLEQIGIVSQLTPVPVFAAPNSLANALDLAYGSVGSPAAESGSEGGAVFTDGPAPHRKFTIYVQTLPTTFGEAMTMRIMEVPKEMGYRLDELGFSDDQLSQIRAWIKSPRGIIAGIGPEGSGKTTPLYAMLREIAGPSVKTLAFADPSVEIPYVTPVSIGTDGAATNQDLLRAAYRGADPDVIFYGTIENAEEAKLLIDIALNGHLVLTTIEAESLADAGEKMLAGSIEPLLLCRTIVGIIVQRLARRLCPSCKEPAPIEAGDPMMRRIREMALAGGYPLPDDAIFYRGRGCPECRGTGYKGKIGLFQVISWRDTLAEAMLSGASGDEIERIAVDTGAPSVLADGIRKAAEGWTTIEEVLRVTSAV